GERTHTALSPARTIAERLDRVPDAHAATLHDLRVHPEGESAASRDARPMPGDHVQGPEVLDARVRREGRHDATRDLPPDADRRLAHPDEPAVPAVLLVGLTP